MQHLLTKNEYSELQNLTTSAQSDQDYHDVYQYLITLAQNDTATTNWLTASAQLYNNEDTTANTLLKQIALETVWQDNSTLITNTDIATYADASIINIVDSILDTGAMDMSTFIKADKTALNSTFSITTSDELLTNGLVQSLAEDNGSINPDLLEKTETSVINDNYNKWHGTTDSNTQATDSLTDTDGDLIPDSLDIDPNVADSGVINSDALTGNLEYGTKLPGYGTADGPVPLASTPPPLPKRDPLSFDLNADGAIGTLSQEEGVFFDLDNSGFAEKTAWIV